MGVEEDKIIPIRSAEERLAILEREIFKPNCGSSILKWWPIIVAALGAAFFLLTSISSKASTETVNTQGQVQKEHAIKINHLEKDMDWLVKAVWELTKAQNIAIEEPPK